METEWAKATSNKDVDKGMTYYSDDAVEMSDDEPSHVGKAAIRVSLLKSFESRKPGTTVSFETMEVFGNPDEVTEVGKTTIRNAAGALVSSGKYVGIYEKRDDKYICIRDINNEDQKPQ